MKQIIKSMNAHKNPSHKPQTNIFINLKEYYENKYFFMIFVPFNQTNKHKEIYVWPNYYK